MRCRFAVHLLTVLMTLIGVLSVSAADPHPPTGWLKAVTFPERSPHSSIEAWMKRVGRAWTGRTEQSFPDFTPDDLIFIEYDLALETVDVRVPGSYRPADAHGIFIWNGVTAPNQDWYEIIARHKLIFVTANGVGGRAPQIRTGLDLDAIHNLSKHYTIDPARIYIAGFSAGAHHSARMIREYPDLIRGALLLSGGIFYDSEKGEPSALGFKWYGLSSLEQIKRDTKIVSITGAGDTVVPPEYGRADQKGLTLDGFERVNYIELPNSGHNHPNSATFEKALELLEAPPKQPPTTEPTKDANPSPAQLAQAERLLTTATRMTENGLRTMPQFRRIDQRNDLVFARACAQKVLDDFPSTSSAATAKELIARIDAKLKSEADERSSAKPHVVRKPASQPANVDVPVDLNSASTTSATKRTKITFSQRSPLSAPDAVLLRLDRQPPQRRAQMDEPLKAMAKWVYELPREPFEVVVPAEYNKTNPHGLVVWLGNGSVPDAYLAPLAQQKLILIAPANRFDERVTIVRIGLALDAVHNAKKKYAIDEKRVYLAGYSGGALLGGWMIRAYPDVFNGALLMMGGWFYHVNRMASDFSPNRVDEEAWYPGRWTLGPRWKAPLDQIKRDLRIVLVRGERDDAFGFTIEQERTQYEGLRLDGFARAKYIEIPRANHDPPSEAWFAEALRALESAPAQSPSTQPTQDDPPSVDAIAQADRLLAAAKQADWNDMDAQAQRIIDDYPHTPAADEARAFLAKGGGRRFWKR
jgi:poly(3-hydroxybutyrate) depolymerase